MRVFHLLMNPGDRPKPNHVLTRRRVYRLQTPGRIGMTAYRKARCRMRLPRDATPLLYYGVFPRRDK
ncbi:MAG: hypothetical protein ACUVTW_11710 [Thermogutta sp.]